MRGFQEQDMFGFGRGEHMLPSDHVPVAPRHLDVKAIILSKGSLDTPERESFVRRICDVYPNATVEEHLGVPHNRIALNEHDAMQLHRKGKRTLLFGELQSAVRFSQEAANTCPNYWHFSTTGFCPYGCRYCYLAGTQGVWFSPTVKIYLNLPEILTEIDRRARLLAASSAFYLGKLQDGLALDPLTAYSTVLVPFFAKHRLARQILLTKSTHVERLLNLEHNGRTILSWSLNPVEIAERYEQNVPSVEDRLIAMERCARQGYPLRAVIMPVIPVENWETLYANFIQDLLSRIPLERLTLGGICIYNNARTLMEHRLGTDNAISRHLDRPHRRGDGRLRYSVDMRVTLYTRLIRLVRAIRPDMPLALCLEEPVVWEDVRLSENIGRCNCVL